MHPSENGTHATGRSTVGRSRQSSRSRNQAEGNGESEELLPASGTEQELTAPNAASDTSATEDANHSDWAHAGLVSSTLGGFDRRAHLSPSGATRLPKQSTRSNTVRRILRVQAWNQAWRGVADSVRSRRLSLKIRLFNRDKTVVHLRMSWGIFAGIATVAGLFGVQVFDYAIFPPSSRTDEVTSAASEWEDGSERIAFNEWTSNPHYGDERNFALVSVYDEGVSMGDVRWMDEVAVAPGVSYVVRVLVHNNARDLEDMMAKDTRVTTSASKSVDSDETRRRVTLTATVTASNAEPAALADSVAFISEDSFHLELVEGSARFWTAGLLSEDPRGVSIPDDLGTSGATVGYTELDGKMPGGKESVGLLTFIVKPRYEPDIDAGWGPGRAIFSVAERSSYATMNSITDNPGYGDERNFARIKRTRSPNSSYADHVELDPGESYRVSLYFSNDANESEGDNGAARDVRARAMIPELVPSGADASAVMFVDSSNASPQEVWDGVTLSNKSAGDIVLRYIQGSAVIHSLGSVDRMNIDLRDLAGDGALLGYDRLDGILPAGAPGDVSFAGYVTFDFVADHPDFTVSFSARHLPEEEWSTQAEIPEGGTSWGLIRCVNTGTIVIGDVVVKIEMPAGLELVNGSVRLGRNLRVGRASDEIDGVGVNVGPLSPGEEVMVWFEVRMKSDWIAENGMTTADIIGVVDTSNGVKQSQVLLDVVR